MPNIIKAERLKKYARERVTIPYHDVWREGTLYYFIASEIRNGGHKNFFYVKFDDGTGTELGHEEEIKIGKNRYTLDLSGLSDS